MRPFPSLSPIAPLILLASQSTRICANPMPVDLTIPLSCTIIGGVTAAGIGACICCLTRSCRGADGMRQHRIARLEAAQRRTAAHRQTQEAVEMASRQVHVQHPDGHQAMAARLPEPGHRPGQAAPAAFPPWHRPSSSSAASSHMGVMGSDAGHVPASSSNGSSGGDHVPALSSSRSSGSLSHSAMHQLEGVSRQQSGSSHEGRSGGPGTRSGNPTPSMLEAGHGGRSPTRSRIVR